MKTWTMTSSGQTKLINQDCVFAKKWILTSGEIGLIAVADGMGGYDCGEKYSQIAIQTLKCRLDKEIYLKNDLSLIINQIFKDADTQIKQCNYAKNKRGGTTLTTVICKNNLALIKNIGDTRCYIIRNQWLEQLSEDHAVFDENNCKTNKLTRCLGMGNFDFPYTKLVQLQKNDCIFICSDGFYKHLKEEEIIQFCKLQDNAFEKVLSLLYDRNETDNISVSLIQL